MKAKTMTALGAALVVAGCGGQGGGANAAAAGGGVTVVRDAALGMHYGSAGPRSCPDRKVPARGPLSPAQAAAYLTCGREGEFANQLYLMGDIKIAEVAKGRPFNYRQDNNVPNIDTTKPVFAIRGSFELYPCNRIDTGVSIGPRYNRGTNCAVIAQPDATGLCYQDTFGRWDCKMSDPNAKYDVRVNVPPPS